MRRLRGAGRPGRRARPDPLGRDQRLPGAGRGVRPAGGRDGGGPGPAGAAAPGPARDGRPGRLAVRLLHAGLHLLDGRRVLPPGPAARVRRDAERIGPHCGRRRPTHDDEHGPNGFDLHALSGNLCRCTGYRPIRDAAYALGQPEAGRPVPGPAGRARAGPRRHRDLERAGPLRPPGQPGRGPRTAGRRAGRAAGGRVHRLGRRAEHQARQGRADHRHRPDHRAARVHGRPRPHRHRRRAEPVRDRGQAGRAGCRCWTRCSRSSRPG